MEEMGIEDWVKCDGRVAKIFVFLLSRMDRLSILHLQRSVPGPFVIHHALLSVPERWGFLHSFSCITRTCLSPLFHGFPHIAGDYSSCNA